MVWLLAKSMPTGSVLVLDDKYQEDFRKVGEEALSPSKI